MIDRLIAFPTVSRDSNLGLIEYARDELDPARRAFAPGLRRERAQGEPVRDAVGRARPREDRRAGAVRPHRHRAGRRPGLVERSVPRDAPRRPHSRPRHRRHEGIHRDRARVGAALPRRAGAPAVASVADLRRGDDLPRRQRPGRRSRGARHPPGGLHHRRADRHAGDRRPQGQARLVLQGARTRSAFGADAAGRERDRVRGAPDRLHPRRGRPPCAR